MLLRDIIYIQNFLQKIYRIKFKDATKAFSLYKYIKRINEYVNFFILELEKLKSKYNITDENNIDNLDYIKEAENLLNMELSDLPNLDIIVDDILESDFGDNPENWLTPDDYNKLFLIIKE